MKNIIMENVVIKKMRRDGLGEVIKNYINLTKPRIMILIIFSGLTTLVLEGEVFFKDPIDTLLIILGLYLTGGCANALNQYFERDIDYQMSRTREKRPLPQNKMSHKQALIFMINLGLIGLFILGFYFNILSSLLGLGSILFYSFFYTLYLKKKTVQNIVIGGIAGSVPPLIAWACVRNSVWDSWTPWFIFLIIFLWTPPHFWALAVYCQDDYKKVNLPMLPVVKGVKKTLDHIYIYSIVLYITSLIGYFLEGIGIIYGFGSMILGGIFVKKAYDLRMRFSIKSSRNLFLYSIMYLFALFFILMIDHIVMSRVQS